MKGTPPDMDVYPMDQIWLEIEAPDVPSSMGLDGGSENACSSLAAPLLPPAAWDYYPESGWKMDDEIKMAPQFSYSEGVGPCF
jgi:myb proto-oncogene protein